MNSAKEVLDYWFRQLKPQQWFVKDQALDDEIREKFQDTLKKAVIGELFQWRQSPDGRLAEIIVLDQFSRNIFRGKPEAFAADPLAVILAQELIAGQDDQKLPMEWRSFAYMPFMHSESLIIHDQAVALFSQPGLERNLEYEIKHRDIIQRFGRYPHRNQILGRPSTPEEIEFLQLPDSSF